jgi:transposase-like protein
MTSLVEIYRRFPTKADCIQHLERVRWRGFPACVYCGADRVSHNRDASRGATAERWKCQRCLKSFSVTVGTIFHNTHVDLQRWFLLIALMMNAKKGLSAMQAARDLEMRRPTVWSMMHRIRRAMDDDGQLLRGVVEMDEVYLGGKKRKSNRRDMDDSPPGATADKTPVVGAVERKGRVKAKVLKHSDLTAKGFKSIVETWMAIKDTLLTTDELASYIPLADVLPHRTISHSVAWSIRDESYAMFGATHTNTIEGFWATVRRAIFGQFHHVSVKYLPLYLREICYKYNDRLCDLGLESVLADAVVARAHIRRRRHR